MSTDQLQTIRDTLPAHRSNSPLLFSPGPWAISSDDYYADRSCLSHSMKEIARDSLTRFACMFMGREPVIEAGEPTKDMKIGTALHCLLFETEDFIERFSKAPECDRRTKEGKTIWANFQALNGNRTALAADDYALVEKMAAAVRANHCSRHLIECTGDHEKIIRWYCEHTGVPCKARIDKIIPGLVVDVKSTTDPSPEAFAKSIVNFGYARQAAWYLDGLRLAGLSEPGEVCEFLFIVAGKEPPHDVAVYELFANDLMAAREENRRLTARIRECIKTGKWENSWSTSRQTISLPPWAWKHLE